MYDETSTKQIIEELKDLIQKSKEIDEDKDAYCILIKSMILNTYSEN